MGVGVICPRCRSSFPFSCNNCSSYEVELYEDFEPLKYFQNRTIYYLKCQDCSSEFDFVKCPSCFTKIIPEPPFVLGDKAAGHNTGCFIATACMGEDSPIIKQLYLLRDDLLEKNYFGKLFIKYYYRYSPCLARHISRRKPLQTITKYVIVYPAYFTSLAAVKFLAVLKNRN